MKKSSALIIVAAFILSSCGAFTQLSSSDSGQRFQDGIYSNAPSFRTKAEKVESQSESQALALKTKESQIYLFGDKKDTVAIPQDMSAMIRYDQKLGGTVVTVGENPYDWRYDLENNYGYYYGPYSIGSSWYWSRHYSPWYSWDFAPWRYHGWYDGWHFGSWYSPYYYGGYYGGWYDPWYWGSHWGWYDPWYSPYYNPYYCGWYGGWDPYWGHHHHHGHGPGYIAGPDHHKDVWYGSRHQTGSERVFGSRTSLRGGIGTSSTVSRNGSSSASRVQASAGSSTGRISSGRAAVSNQSTAVSRSSVVRTTPSIRNERINARNTGSASRGTAVKDVVSAGSQTSPSGRVERTTQPNYRRPAAVTAPSGTVSRESSSSPSYNRAASASDRSASFDRNSSSSPSYNRSNSSSTSRSSFSTGGGSSYSRSSSGGGFSSGGSTRSGGSSGGRR